MPPWKRIIDIGFGAAGTALLPFVVMIVGPFIKMGSPGPLFFGVKRVSAGREVLIWKFRTMVTGAHAMRENLMHLNERSDGPFFKITTDPRVTPVGRLLRKSLIDEWPQFFNVLRGDLSLIGPRAHEPHEVARYPSEYQHIPQAVAGLTGYSQIHGASSLPFLKELEYDNWYLKNQSPWLDLKIIGKTLWLILFRREGK